VASGKARQGNVLLAPGILLFKLDTLTEYSQFEMMRAVGAKAVASVEMAVPPTMVAGELSVERSARERRVELISATAIIRTSTNNHTEWFKTERRVGQRRQAIK
jgi:hypothetical protein